MIQCVKTPYKKKKEGLRGAFLFNSKKRKERYKMKKTNPLLLGLLSMAFIAPKLSSAKESPYTESS